MTGELLVASTAEWLERLWVAMRAASKDMPSVVMKAEPKVAGTGF